VDWGDRSTPDVSQPGCKPSRRTHRYVTRRRGPTPSAVIWTNTRTGESNFRDLRLTVTAATPGAAQFGHAWGRRVAVPRRRAADPESRGERRVGPAPGSPSGMGARLPENPDVRKKIGRSDPGPLAVRDLRCRSGRPRGRPLQSVGSKRLSFKDTPSRKARKCHQSCEVAETIEHLVPDTGSRSRIRAIPVLPLCSVCRFCPKVKGS
jgi:hypothetical protein